MKYEKFIRDMNNFKRNAEDYVMLNFSDYQFCITEEDPISMRMELCKYVETVSPCYYLYDDDFARLLVSDLEDKFIQASKNKEYTIKILTSTAILWCKAITKTLPTLIQPFLQDVFPNKKNYVEQIGYIDLVPETDDPKWMNLLDNEFDYEFMSGDGSPFISRFWPTLERLEKEYPGILVAMMKSCFVLMIMDYIEDPKSTGFITDEHYECFGEPLGLEDLWLAEYNRKFDEILQDN